MNKISVCMATYNGADYIKPQIDSILSQLSKQDELIISDDSSTDATVEIIKQIDDSRIRLLRGSTARNPIFNFENALKQATGDIIFLADQDDVWLPDKVRVMTEELQNCDLVVSDARIIDETGKVDPRSFYAAMHSGPGLLKNICKNTFLGCCMAFRAEVLAWALPFPKDVPMHDMWLGLVAEMFGTTRFCPQVLMHYRRHAENASSTLDPSPFSLSEKLRFRWILIKCLLGRYRQRRGLLK
ncbi:MAG: glycosyltransferase family 2 protein [Planctomycetota bacterium]|jgi:glycosyltransferase involved in cell wall biosynthesis